MPLEVGEVVERYRVEAPLGSGATAAVYRVRHLHLGTIHALKVLLVPTPTDRKRLLAEGQVQARLQHPNIVAVTDVLLVHRSPALVMELVDGPSLEQHLASRGPLPLPEALALFQGIVAGVGAAHAAGLVHRDLKPANVLLGSGRAGERVAKVTDFGLVRSLSTNESASSTASAGLALGTPAYMAPEQIRDPGSVDARADLWALGALLYELLCGTKAFPEPDPFLVFQAIASGLPPAPTRPLPPELVEVLGDLLQVDLQKRIPSCERLWQRLWSEPVPPELYKEAQMALAPAAQMTPAPAASTPWPEARERPADRSEDGPSALWLASAALFGGGAPFVLLGALAAWGTLFGPEEPAGRSEPVAQVPAERSLPQAPAPPPPEPHARVGAMGPVASPSFLPPAANPQPASPPAGASNAVVSETPKRVPAVPAPGRVSVEGDAERVWLEASGQRFEPDRPLPPGHYKVRARWKSGEEHIAGRLEVRSAETILVRCTSFVFACTEIRTSTGEAPR